MLIKIYKVIFVGLLFLIGVSCSQEHSLPVGRSSGGIEGPSPGPSPTQTPTVTLGTATTASEFFTLLRGTVWVARPGTVTDGTHDTYHFEVDTLQLTDAPSGNLVNYSVNAGGTAYQLRYQDSNGCFRNLSFLPIPQNLGEYMIQDSYSRYLFFRN